MRAGVAALAVAALAVSVCAALAAGARAPAPRTETVGHSVRGRPLVARVVGDRAARRSVLVVGCVHGDETAGIAITRALRAVAPPAGTALWLVDAFNPDGRAAHTRQNARGVDLNRNSPRRWRRLTGIFDSGPRPLSEPESRAINGLVRRLRPAVTIWYHQHAALVTESGGDRAIERRYASVAGLPFRRYIRPPGSITSWQNATFPRDTAFVVELPAGRLPARAVARHVAAVLAVAR
jgi:protein MpaA